MQIVKKESLFNKYKNIFFVVFGLLIFLVSKNYEMFWDTVLFASNTIEHRYFTVSYIGFIIFSFLLIAEFYKSKKKNYFFLFIGFLSENLCIHTKKIAQGWHATLAHVPYHSLRLEAIDYLNKEGIKIEEVASFFPNCTTLDLIQNSLNQHRFSEFKGKNKYVFYATVYNISDK